MPSGSLEPNDAMSIAVIGLACRLPGNATDAEMFWNMLCDGRSAVSKVPKSRWNVDSFYHNTKGRLNSSITQNGNFLLQDVSAFDAPFFNISRTEAMGMDPQQRLMLELSYEAFENAGLSIESVAGTQTGCYVGGFTSDWREMQLRDPDSAPLYTFSGVGNEVLANRLSWFYDLRGPSMTVETACSSSLVSLHVACQSIRAGESNLALVGGVNLFLNPDLFAALSNQHFLSPDGLCKAFDASGDGYARGEGCAAVVLKPIDLAIRDGDVIRAVIRATGTNQDGKTRGLTLPNSEAQAKLISSTYQLAGLDLKDTDYFEAHGTGTAAGDLAELGAIGRTLGAARSPGQKLLVGSVKTNIGHTESVAGLAGLIKAIFILERGLIPPNLHFKTPNPNIPFDKWNIKVPTSITEWRSKGIRRISVNSFGFAGANAHAIVEGKDSYLAERKRKGSLSMMNGYVSTNGHASSKVNGVKSLNAKRLFVLTGNDLNSLKRQRLQLSTYVREQSTKLVIDIVQTERFLSDLAFTLSKKRSRLPWKSLCAATTINQLVDSLETEDFTAIRSKSERPQIGFVFTGQGAQWARMGIELLQYNVFRTSVEVADKHLGELGCQWNTIEELCLDEKISRLGDPLYSQTICTVLQVALVDLMSSWGVRPKSVVGHSSGEIAAAYAFGALSRSDACKIAYYRGVLSSQIVQAGTKGAMMAAGCSELRGRALIKRLTCGKAIVACINSPTSVTISGDESAIDELHATFKKEGIFARKLKVETAYHSHHVVPVAGSYFEALRDIQILEAREDCEMFSSVVGRAVDASELGAAYWVRNLVSPVLFSDAVNQMCSPVNAGGAAVLDATFEIGPHAALRGPVMETWKHFGIPEMPYHSIVVRGQDSIQTALRCAETLFGLGVSVDIDAVNNSAITSKASEKYNSIDKPRQLMNLPGYPWDHSQSYWSESRISIEHRNRALPRLSLVGAPYPSFSQHERQWRTFLRIVEEPWIQDHKMQSSILYPAAGFIAMAVEAARQMTDPGKTPHAFRLREIEIDTAVLMDEDSDVECVLQMRPHATGSWFEFNISTSAGGIELQQNCSGLIVIEYESENESTFESAMTAERRLENETNRQRYHEIEAVCSDVEDPQSFYRELESAGMIYGPTFRNITQIRHGSGHSCCTVVIGETGCDPVVPVSNRDDPDAQPHTIHPTVLDSIFQTAFAALKSGLGPMKEALVPNAIAEISVAANMSFTKGSLFRGYTKCSKHGFKDVLADISMLDAELGEEVVGIKGFRCTATGVAAGLEMEEAWATNMCTKLTWRPAVGFLSTEEQKELLEVAISPEAADKLRRTATREETEAYGSIYHALQNFEAKDIANTQLKTFYVWMRAQKEFHESHTVSSQDVAIAGIALSPEPNSTTRVKSRNLADVLLGKKTSLGPDLAEENHLDQYLRNVRGMDVSVTKLSLFLQLLAHTNPALSVLELGSSSAPTMSSSLPASTAYLYTCKNASSLSVAESKVQSLRHNTDFKTLDIEKSLQSQDFAGKEFDIVVAYNIFTGGKDVMKALTNAKKLLKEGGKLCLLEATNPGLAVLSDLGGVPSWWRKSGNQRNRLKNLETLKSRLAFHQFSLEFASHDSEDEKTQQTSLVVATAMKAPTATSVPQINEIMIVEPPNPTETSRSLVTYLKQYLECHGLQGHSLPWGTSISSLKEKNCIVLAELTAPLLTNPTAEDFTTIKEIVLTAKTILWATALEEPASACVIGLARAVRNELATIRFRTLKVTSLLLSSTDLLASLITKVVTTASADDEIREENGILEIPRLEVDGVMNEYVGDMLRGEKIFPTQLAKAGGPLKLHIGNPGMLDSLYFKPVENTDDVLKSDEVEVQVRASGLNFRDIMVSMGQIPDKFIGLEASGSILRVGNKVQNFKIGDEVSFLGHGAHSTVFRTNAAFCQLIPSGLSFAQAACLPLAHCTAYHALVNTARARKGQSILIHSAAGGVGQATVQLAQHLGLEIFATVGSPEKRKLLRDIYDLPDDHILYSRDLSFAKAVSRLTNGRGVDCVLNSLAGEALRQTWHCIAPFGIFIEIGIKDVLRNSGLDMAPFLRDTTFATINLEHIQRERPELMAEIMTETFALLQKGVTKPICPMIVYSASEVESAFRLMQTGKHTGKIALEYRTQDIVPVLRNPDTMEDMNINDHSTYVLVGGLGGLGRSLAKLLVNLGARYICFISRSGTSSTSPEMTKSIDDLRSREVQVNIYNCDIADLEILEETLQKCSSEMPPIKGVFQCAMVLQDALFEKMTHAQWNNSLRSKVQGSWNLHKAMPTSLDFFIMLSSFSGIIGNRGQSNYAAACTYQDALSMLRHKKGLKTISIDLGIMRDVGTLAENGAIGDLKKWEEPFGIREPEFHALIKRAIGQLPVKQNEDNADYPVPPQIITGIPTVQAFVAAGISEPFYYNDAKFSIMTNMGRSTNGHYNNGSNRSISIHELLSKVESHAEATSLILAALVARVAKLSQKEVADVDVQKSLHSYGVDSLVAVEIRSWIVKEMLADVSVFEVLASVAMVEFVGTIVKKCKGLPDGIS